MRFRNSQVGDATHKVIELGRVRQIKILTTRARELDSRGPTAVARARDRKRRDHGVEGDHARERDEYEQGRG